MKEIVLTSCYVIAACELVLGFYFLATNSKIEIRKVMALLSFSTAIWVALSAVTSYHPYSSIGYFETAILFLSASVLITAILHFSLIYPFKLFRFDRLHVFLLYLPTVLFGWNLFFSRTIVSTFYGSPTDPGGVVGGPLYVQYNVYLAVIYLVAMTILVYRIIHSAGYFKKALSLVLSSFIFGGLPGVIFYLIVPSFSSGVTANPFIGVIPTIIWVGVTSYIVIK